MILGVGADLSNIDRFSRAISRRGDRLLRRIFTEGEIAYCRSTRNPPDHFAARFAAKEALFKALGTGWGKGMRWKDVEVRAGEGGRPILCLGGAARRLAGSMGAGRVWVSLSTDGSQALAVVVLESAPEP